MKELLSHSVQGDLKELMLFMAEKVKKQKLRSNKKANLNLEERTLVPNIIAADSAAEVESKTNGTLTSKAQVEAQLKSQGKNQNSVKIYAPKHAQYYAQNNTQYKTNSKTIMQTNRKAIPQAIQKHIRNKYHSCQYINKHNGQVCTSKWQLQIEHIKPVWAGGDNTIENLSLLCARHNQYQYKVQAGIL